MRPILALLLFSPLLLGMGKPPRIHSGSRELMHTRWDFSVVARGEHEAEAAIEAAAAEVERLDRALAMWREDSELHAFNAQAGKGPQAVSADLDRVLSLGQQVSALSQGASDCTVGPLVQLWYRHLQEGSLPPAAAIKAAKARLDYRALKREADGRWSAPAGTVVDLGSLAKGYAQDRAAVILEARGLRAYLMNAGGQVYARGLKPGGQPWKVGIQHPREAGRVVAIVPLTDQALSTSGDYEQASTVKGRRYHHIIDPRTGSPTTHGTCSVTVILPLQGAPSPGAGAWCDALDTAALVLGQAEGKAFLEGQHASGVLLKDLGRGVLSGSLTADLDGKPDLVLGD